MSKLNVLVTTMHQSDFQKYYDMNIQTDAVIANQSNNIETIENIIDDCKVKLVTTNTKGVSKNRNIAIDNSFDCDFVMFSDDDLKFHIGYENTIIKVFQEHPEVDAVKFNINSISKRKISMKPILRFHKVSRNEISSWRLWGLVIRKKVLVDNNIRFNERFGPGTENYCGEDTIFLQEIIKKKIRFYATPEYIADIDQTASSWFEGHNERYITTAGMIIHECYPLLSNLIVLRSAYKFSRRNDCTLSFLNLLKCYYEGIQKNRKERKDIFEEKC